MDTLRVNIAYRPLRICWVIREGDHEGFRRAVRTNHTLWGGRFNPIVVADREPESRSLVEVFRADVLMAASEADDTVNGFVEKFPHLISPLHGDHLILGRGEEDATNEVLDIHNALVYLADRDEWARFKESEPRIYTWEEDDPLSDIFLIQLGQYPTKEAIQIDYAEIFANASDAQSVRLESGLDLPEDILNHPSVSHLSRVGLQQHHSVRSSWNYPGFYLGDASDLSDLITFWNLRAANVRILFLDRRFAERLSTVREAWRKRIIESSRPELTRDETAIAVWYRRTIGNRTDDQPIREMFPDSRTFVCGVDEPLWNGLNLLPPTMCLGGAASLGVLLTDGDRPKLSFSLNDRPYSTNPWFFNQHLVASLSFVGGLYGHEETLVPPYVPELNEFYSRSMHVLYDRLRIETEGVGLIIHATDTDSFLYALRPVELFREVFKLTGFATKPSAAGLIVRQLMSQLGGIGGIQGARVFKIPGVRRLIRTYGPTSSFSRQAALQLIGDRDPDNPGANFKNHEDLFLEPRPRNQKLTPPDVFGYLVEKRIFRIGVDLDCPYCQLTSWTTLNELNQDMVCQLCGESFDATRQLVESVWKYRRSGVLGVERNVLGSLPVALTLQQLDANLSHGSSDRVYTTSLELVPLSADSQLPTCEVDFAWIGVRSWPKKSVLLIGECKDRGGTINEADIQNLKAVRDAVPASRFEVYIVLAKLGAFTAREIELATSINDEHRLRIILLTDRELEPYRLYERTKELFQVDQYAGRPEDLAAATVNAFLDPKPLE